MKIKSITISMISALMVLNPLEVINPINAKEKTVFKSNVKNFKKNKSLKINSSGIDFNNNDYTMGKFDKKGNITIVNNFGYSEKRVSIIGITNSKSNLTKITTSNKNVVRITNSEDNGIIAEKPGKALITVYDGTGEKLYFNITVKKVKYQYEYMDYSGKVKKLSKKLKKTPSDYVLAKNRYIYGNKAYDKKNYVVHEIYMPFNYATAYPSELKESFAVRKRAYNETGVKKLKREFNCDEYKAYLMYKWIVNNTTNWIKAANNGDFYSTIGEKKLWFKNGKYRVNKGDRSFIFKFLCDALNIKCVIRPLHLSLTGTPVYASVKINGKWYIVDPDAGKFLSSNVDKNGKYKKGNTYNNRTVKAIFTSTKYDYLDLNVENSKGEYEIAGWENGLWMNHATTNRIPSKYISKIVTDPEDSNYTDLYFKSSDRNTVSMYLFGTRSAYYRPAAVKTVQVDGGNEDKYSYNNNDDIYTDTIYDENGNFVNADYCYVKVKKI